MDAASTAQVTVRELRYYTFSQDQGGSEAIIGFKPSDRISLVDGFTAADVAATLRTATTGAFGTALTLGDGTTVTLFGATLTAAQISAG